MALILIAEDEHEIAEMIRLYLEHAGHRTLLVHDGYAAIQHHRRHTPDLALIDVGLPGLDGFAVLDAIRKTADTPAMMVTALGQSEHRLLGLRSGADDYIVKPFDPHELVARVEAVLRRVTMPRRRPVLRAGALMIDVEAMNATVEGTDGTLAALDLTATQLRLLAHLARSPGRVHTRGDLVAACLPVDGEALERTVDSHLSKIRRKLAAHGLDELVQAVRSVGYRIAV
jgi:two-component system response regulator AdeR